MLHVRGSVWAGCRFGTLRHGACKSWVTGLGAGLGL